MRSSLCARWFLTLVNPPQAAPLLQAASGTHLLDWSSLTDTGLLLALCSALALGSSSGTGSIMSMLHAQAGSAPGLVSALLSVGQAAAAKELATASDAAAAALARWGQKDSQGVLVCLLAYV